MPETYTRAVFSASLNDGCNVVLPFEAALLGRADVRQKILGSGAEERGEFVFEAT